MVFVRSTLRLMEPHRLDGQTSVQVTSPARPEVVVIVIVIVLTRQDSEQSLFGWLIFSVIRIRTGHPSWTVWNGNKLFWINWYYFLLNQSLTFAKFITQLTQPHTSSHTTLILPHQSHVLTLNEILDRASKSAIQPTAAVVTAHTEVCVYLSVIIKKPCCFWIIDVNFHIWKVTNTWMWSKTTDELLFENNFQNHIWNIPYWWLMQWLNKTQGSVHTDSKQRRF